MPNYEILEHTADIRVKIKGKNLKDLFRNAGLAIFQISTQKLATTDDKIKNLSIKQKADNLDELFINWLNELLSLSAVKGLIFEDLKIGKINANSIEAVVSGSDIKNYKVNTEIKAATYHELKIEKSKSAWQAEVIIDV